jgi:hypothetical protein
MSRPQPKVKGRALRAANARLSESFNLRLTAYAMAAGAAGVGLLAATPPAHADIVFTPINRVFTDGRVYIDLDHDGANDFVLSIYNFGGPQDRRLAAQGVGQQNGVLGYSFGPSYPPYALVAGARIGGGARNGVFWHRPGSAVNVAATFGTIIERPFANAGDRYLGLKFKINGLNHYGWALLNAKAGAVDHRPMINVTLKGYAYNTEVGIPIHAGQISASAKSEMVPEAGTLAALALGWPVWRRKEEEQKASGADPIPTADA